ncbi:F-box only protein 5 [Hyperolius riggenbachi]|uniref:F-box only protein 5 n=1 Tax=Hyperolius riggenbachi TaxID=752182 RepID=UPI0035A39B01
MKCGYKTPTKLSPSKAKHETSPTKYESSPTKHESSPIKYLSNPAKHNSSPAKREPEGNKECRSPQTAECLETSIDHLSPSKVDVPKPDRPLYNKENLLRRLSEVETKDVDCSPLQDSGYASILHDDSQYQDEEGDFSKCTLSPTSFETPKQHGLQNEKPLVVSRTLLPALHFEEAMCSTLKRNFRRGRKIYLDAFEEMVSREDYGLDKLIGKKMGLERLDILGELFKRDFKHILGNILRHLGEMDLINVVSVSTTWKKIVQSDSWAYRLYEKCYKEKCEIECKNTKSVATREESLFRIPLHPVQKVASAAVCVSKRNGKNKHTTPHSRHTEFSEVGKTLINNQSLKVCTVCGSPAKYDSYQNRAICTRHGCLWDFCTLCNCKYHFSKDCPTSKPQSHKCLSETLPGSKKSKQNLRRL